MIHVKNKPLTNRIKRHVVLSEEELTEIPNYRIYVGRKMSKQQQKKHNQRISFSTRYDPI